MLTPKQRFLNIVLRRGKRPGYGELTFKRILEDTVSIRQALQKPLSLDYQYTNPSTGDAYTLEDFLPSSAVSGPRPKTTLEEVNERDIQSLTARVHREISTGWRERYDKGRDGTKLALKVFDGLCANEPLSTMARRLRTTRQRVSQIRDQLVTLPAVKRLRKELRSMKSV